MKDYSTIIQSIATEKSSRAQEINRYTFMVKRDATKIDVKHAVKTIFGADVASVKTMLMPKKTRLIRGNRLWAKRPVFKKAIVTLKGKATIDPNKIGSMKTKKK